MLGALSKGAKTAEAARAVSKVSRLDEAMSALAKLNNNKAISAEALSGKLTKMADVPEALKPYAQEVLGGVVFNIDEAAAKALGAQPQQVKLLNEINKGKRELAAGDQSIQAMHTEALLKERADQAAKFRTPSQLEKEKAASAVETPQMSASTLERKGQLDAAAAREQARLQEEANAAVLAGEAESAAQWLADRKVKEATQGIGETPSQMQARRAQASQPVGTITTNVPTKEELKAEALSKAAAAQDAARPRPTFEGPTAEDQARLGTKVLPSAGLTKEEALGKLQSGEMLTPADEVAQLASKGKKATKATEFGIPVRNDSTSRAIANELAIGNKLSPEAQSYMQYHSDDVMRAAADMKAGKITGEPAIPTQQVAPQVPEAPKITPTEEALTAQTKVASAEQAANEVTKAAESASMAPIAGAPAEAAQKPGILGKLLKYGTIAGAVGTGANMLMQGKKASDDRAAVGNLPKTTPTVLPVAPAQEAPQQISYQDFLSSLLPEELQRLAPSSAVQQEPQGYSVANTSLVSGNADQAAGAGLMDSIAQNAPSAGPGWLERIANAMAIGGETYTTGVDARRANAESELRQMYEKARLPHADELERRAYYERQQAAYEAQLRQQMSGYSSTKEKDIADFERTKALLGIGQQEKTQGLLTMEQAKQQATLDMLQKIEQARQAKQLGR